MEYSNDEVIKMFITGKNNKGEDIWQYKTVGCEYELTYQEETTTTLMKVNEITLRNEAKDRFDLNIDTQTLASNYADKKLILIQRLFHLSKGFIKELHEKLIKQLGKENELKTWVYSINPDEYVLTAHQTRRSILGEITWIASQPEPNISAIENLKYLMKKLIRLEPEEFEDGEFEPLFNSTNEKIYKNCRAATVWRKLKDSKDLKIFI